MSTMRARLKVWVATSLTLRIANVIALVAHIVNSITPV